MFYAGQRVVINCTPFDGVKGVILYKHEYYRVRFDYTTQGCKDGLFTKEELELCEPKDIMDYLKHKLLEDI